MKKKIDYLKITRDVLRVAFLSFLFLFLGTVVLFAQDSTAVAQVNGFLEQVGSWPLAAKIASAMAIVSEILSIIPEKYVPANGIVHSIILWVKAIKWKK